MSTEIPTFNFKPFSVQSARMGAPAIRLKLKQGYILACLNQPARQLVTAAGPRLSLSIDPEKKAIQFIPGASGAMTIPRDSSRMIGIAMQAAGMEPATYLFEKILVSGAAPIFVAYRKVQ